MRTSAQGLRALTAEEGLHLEPYVDGCGDAAIGIGHRLHGGPVRAADEEAWAGMSRDDAIEMFDADVRLVEQVVLDAVRVEVNENEFDALVSLAFSIGAAAFASSVVVRRLNAGDRRAAAEAFLLWDVCSRADRRRRERSLFLAGVEPCDRLATYTASERRWVREYDRLTRGGDADCTRARTVRSELTAQRKRIWRAAQESGWEVSNRRARYLGLLARTT